MVKKKSARRSKKSFPMASVFNGIFLTGWLAVLLAQFEVQALGGAVNTNGGVLFAQVIITFGYVLFAGALWVRGAWSDLPPTITALSGLVPLLFLEGARVSAGSIFTLNAMPWYVLANSCFAAILLLWKDKKPGLGMTRVFSAAGTAWFWGLGLALALGVAIVMIRNWTLGALSVPADKNSLGLLFDPRNGGGATDISARPFTEYYRLIAPLQFLVVLAVALFLYLWALRTKKIKEHWIWISLVVLAVLGKLSIAFVSDQGLGILGIKIESINTNYYHLTELIRQKGLWGYLTNYNELQHGQGAHGESHPFGPVVFYWVLTLILGKNPGLIAFAVATITALSAPLIYRIASGYYRSREAGVVAALLYLSSPMSLIFSSAGIDSMLLVWLALVFWALQRGHEAPHWKWGVLAGSFFFLGSLFSFGLAISLIFAGLWTLDARHRLSSNFKETFLTTLLIWGPLILTVLLEHGLLYGLLLGKFSYIKSMDTAEFVHRSINEYRTYELWSWANVLLVCGYVGLATLSAWLLRQCLALWRGENKDGFLLLSLMFVLTLVFACMGRAEVHRIFIFSIIFLAVPAAPYFLETPQKGSWGLRPWLLFAMVSLNVLNAVVLEITVLDFW